jgi:hypothetical protein
MIYNVDKKTVEKNLKKLKPLKYNRFFWWRRYVSTLKPLPKKASLWDKILNGEYDFSDYYWQIKQAELEINEIYDQYYNYDNPMFIQEASLPRARRKRLINDFENEEKKRLDDLQKEFIRNFFITKQQYKQEIEEFDKSIKDFYLYCEKRYGKRLVPKSNRGRPPKKK